jgi:DNA/RNA endonuclease YhcR with UshA esterase domain
MRNDLFAGLAVGAILLALSGPMFGHHNTASRYAQEHPVTVAGTVKRFRMVNPHGRIEVEVKEESGGVALWDIESGSASGLYRRGWRTSDLKPGDRVTVTGSPAVDGSKSMVLIKLVTADGKVLE